MDEDSRSRFPNVLSPRRGARCVSQCLVCVTSTRVSWCLPARVELGHKVSPRPVWFASSEVAHRPHVRARRNGQAGFVSMLGHTTWRDTAFHAQHDAPFILFTSGGGGKTRGRRRLWSRRLRAEDNDCRRGSFGIHSNGDCSLSGPVEASSCWQRRTPWYATAVVCVLF